MDNLWKLDASSQARLVRERQVTPLELIETAVARIERINPSINAVITTLYDEARSQAGRQSPPNAPFWGVPLLLKDAVLEVAEAPYYVGTRVLKEVGWRSRHDTWLASRFRRAGFIFIGKTNVPELSSGITTEPEAFGPTRNPWELTRTAGGLAGARRQQSPQGSPLSHMEAMAGARFAIQRRAAELRPLSPHEADCPTKRWAAACPT